MGRRACCRSPYMVWFWTRCPLKPGRRSYNGKWRRSRRGFSEGVSWGGVEVQCWDYCELGWWKGKWLSELMESKEVCGWRWRLWALIQGKKRGKEGWGWRWGMEMGHEEDGAWGMEMLNWWCAWIRGKNNNDWLTCPWDSIIIWQMCVASMILYLIDRRFIIVDLPLP